MKFYNYTFPLFIGFKFRARLFTFQNYFDRINIKFEFINSFLYLFKGAQSIH